MGKGTGRARVGPALPPPVAPPVPPPVPPPELVPPFTPLQDARESEIIKTDTMRRNFFRKFINDPLLLGGSASGGPRRYRLGFTQRGSRPAVWGPSDRALRMKTKFPQKRQFLSKARTFLE